MTKDEAARIMYAAEKWAQAVDDRHYAIPSYTTAVAREKNAKQAFADLIAIMTDGDDL